MKIYKVAIIDVHESEGHISIPQMTDLVKGNISPNSYTATTEIPNHLNECPICYENYLELKQKYQNLNDATLHLDNSFLKDMKFYDKDPRYKP